METIDELIENLKKYSGFDLETPIKLGIGNSGKIVLYGSSTDENILEFIEEAISKVEEAKSDLEYDLDDALDELKDLKEKVEN